MLPLFFKLIKCQDKILRKRLTEIITTDLARINIKHKNNTINKKIQNFCLEMMKDPNRKAVRKTLNIMISLYRKKVFIFLN
jgi:protein SDA1